MGDPSSPTGVEAPSVSVVVADEQDEVDVDAERWAALAAAVLADHGVVGELTLTFVDSAEIEALNAEHMGKRGPTDVLSFPLDSDEAIASTKVFGEEAPPVLLGDVVICPEVAAGAALTHAGSVDDELALLTVHGVLHVLGFDHAEAAETAEMRAAELEALRAHHWRGPAPDGFRQEHPA